MIRRACRRFLRPAGAESRNEPGFPGLRSAWPRIRYDRLMAFGWKVQVPMSLAVVFITATGIVLADLSGNSLWFYMIPFASLLVVLVAAMFVYRALRRKAYERA